jgi:Flp pilus assembly pilin Flp
MLLKLKKAQSTLEYVLVLTAIVGVILWAAVSLVKPKVQKAFDDTATSIENTADEVAPK